MRTKPFRKVAHRRAEERKQPVFTKFSQILSVTPLRTEAPRMEEPTDARTDTGLTRSRLIPMPPSRRFYLARLFPAQKSVPGPGASHSEIGGAKRIYQ